MGVNLGYLVEHSIIRLATRWLPGAPLQMSPTVLLKNKVSDHLTSSQVRLPAGQPESLATHGEP